MAVTIDGKLQNTINQLKIVELPTEVLLHILKFCDSATLRNLTLTCKRLNEVSSEDCVWLKHSNVCAITNQLSSEILRRSFKRLRPKEKCRINANWEHGYYTEKSYRTTIKYMPWMHLEDDMLWMTQGKVILAVPRLRNGLLMRSPLHTIQTDHTEDISRFVKRDNILYSGGKDGCICGWSLTLNQLVFFKPKSHTQDIQGLDCKRNILVSGSKDGTIKVWKVDEDGMLNTGIVLVRDRVWCVALDPSFTWTAAGSAGYSGIPPFHLYDLERGVEKPMIQEDVKKGAAVFDIHWECPNTLLTCGFDSVTRLWDTRIGRCVRCWSDPFGEAGYCLASDLSHSVLCGTAYHGRVQFWDKRSSTSIQAYFGRNTSSSPVYSVGFDTTHLFIAQDSCINLLDFSPYYKSGHQHLDYSSCW